MNDNQRLLFRCRVCLHLNAAGGVIGCSKSCITTSLANLNDSFSAFQINPMLNSIIEKQCMFCGAMPTIHSFIKNWVCDACRHTLHS